MFAQGIERYSRGQHAEALAAFEATYAARPVPNVLSNLGMCYRALDRIPEAVNAFHHR